MTDEVVRLKAEVRELQEALAAERAKPAQVRTVEKRVEVPGPVRTREVVKPDPAVAADRDRLRRKVRELQEALTAERAKPAQVRTVERPDPKVAAERDRLRHKVHELEEALDAERAKPAQVREVEVEKRVEVPDPAVVAERDRLRRRVNELTAGRSASNSKDQVARLKAEVRELQEALQAFPVAAEERDRLLQLVKTLRKQISDNAKRERELVQYLEGMKRGRNDQ